MTSGYAKWSEVRATGRETDPRTVEEQAAGKIFHRTRSVGDRRLRTMPAGDPSQRLQIRELSGGQAAISGPRRVSGLSREVAWSAWSGGDH